MNNLYNFEAIFNLFTKSIKTTRKTEKRYLVFFRGFVNWLVFTLSAKVEQLDVVHFLPFLSDSALKKYSVFLSSSRMSRPSIRERIVLLTTFKTFLESHNNLKVKGAKNINHLVASFLLDEFIVDLDEEGVSRSTLRSYKSDVSQFFSFIEKDKGFDT